MSDTAICLQNESNQKGERVYPIYAAFDHWGGELMDKCLLPSSSRAKVGKNFSVEAQIKNNLDFSGHRSLCHHSLKAAVQNT